MFDHNPKFYWLFIGYYYNCQIIRMNTFQQKQSRALSSLHDISDYTSYIDQRINRLNLLYQKLSLNTNDKFENKKQKMAKSQVSNHRMYETVKQRFGTPKRQQSSFIKQMYHTEFVSKRNHRYAQPVNISNSIELKTSIFSNGRSYQSSKKSNAQSHKIPIRNNGIKLRDYQKIKNELMSTFYVGNKQSNDSKFESREKSRNIQWKDSDIKIRRGRVWNGRPPVKIVQKYE